MMNKIKFPTDRQILSTENNGYADGTRDESLWPKDLVDTEIPETDAVIEAYDEDGTEDREVYDEEGFLNDPQNS